jgi:hypothetical protein
VTAIALLVAVGGACSGDDGESADLGDPCTLLSADDVAQVTDVELTAEPVENTTETGQALCVWLWRAPPESVPGATDVQDAPSVSVRISTDDPADRRAWAEEERGIDTMDASVAGAERAYIAPGAGWIGMVVGDHYLEVRSTGGDIDDDELVALGATVVTNFTASS